MQILGGQPHIKGGERQFQGGGWGGAKAPPSTPLKIPLVLVYTRTNIVTIHVPMYAIMYLFP